MRYKINSAALAHLIEGDQAVKESAKEAALFLFKSYLELHLKELCLSEWIESFQVLVQKPLQHLMQLEALGHKAKYSLPATLEEIASDAKQNMQHSIQALLDYQRSEARSADKKAVLKGSIKNFPQAYARFLNYLEEIAALNHNEATTSLHLLAENFCQDLALLSAQECLLIPGGFHAADKSHCLIYQFYLEQNVLLFRVFNQGIGLFYHEKKTDLDKTLFYPALTYQIPLDKIRDPYFKEIFLALLDLKINPCSSLKAGAKRLYQEIVPVLLYVDASFQSTSAQSPAYLFEGLGSESCQDYHQSLLQLMKFYFQEADLYQRFLYDYHAYALKTCLAQNNKEDLASACLIRALRGQLNALNQKQALNPRLFLFEDDFREAEKKDLEHNLGYFEKAKKPALAPLAHTEPQKTEPSDLAHRLNYFPFYKPAFEQQEERPKSHFLFNPAKKLRRLFEDLEKTQAICKNLMHSKQYYEMLHCLEAFFLALPLPTSFDDVLLPFYQGIKGEKEAIVFYRGLNDLQNHYFEAQQHLHGNEFLTPSMYLVKMTVLAVSAYLESYLQLNGGLYFYNRFGVSSMQPEESYRDGIRFHSLFPELMSTIVELNETVYLATENPAQDERLQRIRHLFDKDTEEKPYSPAAFKLQYYQRLLDHETAYLVKNLEKIYQNELNKEELNTPFQQWIKGQAACALYCFLQLRAGRKLNTLYSFEQHQESEALVLDNQGFLNALTALAKAQNLTNFDEKRFETQALKVLLRFDFQAQLERAYCKGLGKFLLDNVEPRLVPLGFCIKEKAVYFCTPTKSYGYDLKVILTKRLCEAKYSLGLESRQYALEHDSQVLPQANTASFEFNELPVTDFWILNKRTDNHTQLYPALFHQSSREDIQRKLSTTPIDRKVEVEQQQLFHLRRVKETQLILSLEYFNKHLDKLSRPQMQAYLEANLSQPGLILAALSAQDPIQFLPHFDEFIKNGLNFFEQKKDLSSASVFFIRLAYLVNQYAYKFDPKKYALRFESYLVKLNSWIAGTRGVELKRDLHQYRLLALIDQYYQSPQKKMILREGLSSYFYLRLLPHAPQQVDKSTAFHFEKQFQLFKHILATYAKLIRFEDLIEALEAVDLAFSYQNLELLNFEYPLVHCKDRESKKLYTIHIEEGTVFQDNLLLKVLPFALSEHPLKKTLQLEEIQNCLVSKDESIYLIEQEKPFPLALRFIKEAAGFCIQKKWLDSQGKKVWYQLLVQSEAVARSLQLSPRCILSVKDAAPVLKDSQFLAWIREDEAEIILTNRDNHCIYRGEKILRKEEAWRFEKPESGAYLLSHATLKLPEVLLAFEDSGFILSFLKKDGTRLYDLPRYRLTFFSLPEEKAYYFHWQGLNYQLDTKTRLSLQGALTLHCVSEEKTLCILPVQPFILKPQAEEDRMGDLGLSLDIHPTLAQEKLKQGGLSAEEWSYQGSASAFILTLKAGAPYPQRPAEALYLSYAYLAQEQRENAWQCLESCRERLGGLQGSYEELHYLSLLLDSLPQCLRPEEDANFIHPVLLPFQLKALALVAHFLLQDKVFVFESTEQTGHHRPVFQEQQYVAQSKKLLETIDERVARLYAVWQTQRSKSPSAFKIDEQDAKSLLQFYYQSLRYPQIKGKKKAPALLGALDYEYFYYHLKTLHQHYRTLKTKEESITLSVYEQKSLQEMQGFVEEHPGVEGFSTNLASYSLDLSFKAAAKENKLFPPIALKDLRAYSEADCREAIKNLSFGQSEQDFLKDFPLYLALLLYWSHQAFFADSGLILKTFCEKKLKFSAHLFLAKNENPMSLIPLTGKMDIFYQFLYLLNNAQLTASVWKNLEGKEALSYSDLMALCVSLSQEGLGLSIYRPVLQNQPMVSTQAIWNAIDSKYQAPDSLLEPSVLLRLKKTFKLPFASLANIDSIKELRVDWALLKTQFISDTDPQDKSLHAGEAKYQAFQALQAKAESYLGQPQHLKQLFTEIAFKRMHLFSAQEDLAQSILTLAQKGPSTRQEKLSWDLALAAKERKLLDLDGLLNLYFQADRNLYAKETALSTDEIEGLHSDLGLYLAQGLDLQQLERIVQLLQEAKCLNLKTEENVACHRHPVLFQLAEALCEENQVDVLAQPFLALFQYRENILFRPTQKKVLEELLQKENGRYKEVLEKIIMGGGKSKILLPALAKAKAQGDNLVLIEVPAALLETNYQDLNALSTRLFNQKAYTFTFKREQPHSSLHLEKIYQHFLEVMVNKHYILTTGDSLQSLELQFLEVLEKAPPKVSVLSLVAHEGIKKEGQDVLLLNEDKGEKAFSTEQAKHKKAYERYQEWEKQVECLAKLLNLLRSVGDLLIDEVHLGLALKNKLNYTLGVSESLDPGLIHQAVELYQFLYLDLKTTLETELGIKLSIYAKKKSGVEQEESSATKGLEQELLTKKNLEEEIRTFFVEALTAHPKSPLSAWIERTQKHTDLALPDFRAQLALYLKNEGEVIPRWVEKASVIDKIRLALYKEEVSALLPHTLLRHLHEHFGPSHDKRSAPEQRVVAIPYVANMVPNESSRFGNPLETLNYTIQGLLSTGLPEDLLIVFLKNLKRKHREQQFKSGAKPLEKTQAASFFALLVQDHSELNHLSLAYLDLDDKVLSAKLHGILAQNLLLIFEVLKDLVLKHIRVDRQILHNNAFNHVEIVRSLQGFSGTLSKAMASQYHQRLSYDHETIKGLDEYILKGIIAKKPDLHLLDYQGLSAFIQSLFALYSTERSLRAIIDISATFEGIKNFTVAKEIALYLSQQPQAFSKPKPLQYVLYFNENNQLSALKLGTQLKEPLLINSSESKLIKDILGCGPEACFSYYDQAHTIGADLRQADAAKALVMVNEQTFLSAFLQGAMRMRGLLEANQRLDLILPTRFRGFDLSTLVKRMTKTELDQIQRNNFDATLGKMTNIVRANFLGRMLSLNEDPKGGEDKGSLSLAERRLAYYLQFRAYFVSSKLDSFFEYYGSLNKIESTPILLQAHKEKLLSDWKRLVKTKPGMDIKILKEASILENELNKIVQAASQKGFCTPFQRYKSESLGVQVFVQQEVEIQEQVEVQEERQVQIQVSPYDPFAIETAYVPWLELYRARNNIDLAFKSLTEICHSVGSQRRVPSFHPRLYASKNFYQVYEKQNNYLNRFLKPIYTLFFQMIEGKLWCTILSQQECAQLSKMLVYGGQQAEAAWISTLGHQVLSGTALKGFQQQDDYLLFIAQALYLNGDWKTLEAYKCQWLTENLAEKITFFAELQPARETLNSDLQAAKMVLSSATEIYQFIEANPLKDLRSYPWRVHFPQVEFTENDLEDYRRFSIVLNRLSAKPWHQHFSLEKIVNIDKVKYSEIYYLQGFILKRERCESILEAFSHYLEKRLTLLNQDNNNALITKSLTKKQLSFVELKPAKEAAGVGLNISAENYRFALALQKIMQNVGTESAAILDIFLALNSAGEAEDWEKLVEESARDKNCLLRLLLDHASKISPQIYGYLLELKQNTYTLLGLASHQALSPSHLWTLLDKAQGLSVEAKIFNCLLHRPTMDAEQLFILVKHPAFKPAFILDFIQRRLDISSHWPLLRFLVEKSEDKQLVEAWVKYPYLDRLPGEIIDVFFEKPFSEGLWDALIKHPGMTKERLKICILKAKTAKILMRVLTQSKIALDAEIYSTLAQHPAVDAAFLEYLCFYAESSPALCFEIAKAPAADTAVWLSLAKIRDPALLMQLAALKHRSKIDEEVVSTFLYNPCTPLPILETIVQGKYKVHYIPHEALLSHPNLSTALLENMVECFRFDEEEWYLIAAHSKASPKVLMKLIQEAEENSTLEQLLLCQEAQLTPQLIEKLMQHKAIETPLLKRLKSSLSLMTLSEAQKKPLLDAVSNKIKQREGGEEEEADFEQSKGQGQSALFFQSKLNQDAECPRILKFGAAPY